MGALVILLKDNNMMKQLIHYYNKYCIGQFVEMNRCVDEYFYPKTKNGWLYLCVKGAHQYCINNGAIKSFITNLIGININQLQSQKYCDFEDLYAHIARCQVKGIGDLTLYDTALRIGHVMHPCIYPKQYVYLARGAKKGAEILLGRKVGWREPIDVFRPYFGDMPSRCIEDFLCIMKDLLYKGGVINGVNIKGRSIYVNGILRSTFCCDVANNSFICPNAYDQNITAIDCISDDCDNGDTHFDL